MGVNWNLPSDDAIQSYIYPYGDDNAHDRSGPVYGRLPMQLVTASAAMREFQQACTDLCVLQAAASQKRGFESSFEDEESSLLPRELALELWKRRFTSYGSPNRRTNGQSLFSRAIAGVLSGELAFHYARWLPTGYYRSNEVMLEVAYYIGPTVNFQLSQEIRDIYADTRHTPRDRWVVFHFHIPIDSNTFANATDGPAGEYDYRVGVSVINVYHGQRVVRSSDAQGA